jgi:hypothetical protein
MPEWNPVYKVETRVTIMGREPWELGVLLAVMFVINLSSRDWAGPIGSVFVTIIAVIIVNVILKRVKQIMPTQAMLSYWQWLLSSDVYEVRREEICKPLILDLRVSRDRT